MPTTRRKKSLSLRELGRWRLIAEFQQRLAPVCERLGLPPTFRDPKRKLQIGDYLSLFLFGLLNPAVRTMRALCAASDLERMQSEVCGDTVSLGSFSEAQAVVDPALLEAVFAELASEVKTDGVHPQFGARAADWMIVDSTLWEVLPRMHWALWRRQGRSQSAVRLHIGVHVLDEKPVRAQVTPGRVCERKAWREGWQEGDAYIGDRYFGEDYRLFGELNDRGGIFVLRLCQKAVIEIDTPRVSELDVAAGRGVLITDGDRTSAALEGLDQRQQLLRGARAVACQPERARPFPARRGEVVQRFGDDPQALQLAVVVHALLHSHLGDQQGIFPQQVAVGVESLVEYRNLDLILAVVQRDESHLAATRSLSAQRRYHAGDAQRLCCRRKATEALLHES